MRLVSTLLLTTAVGLAATGQAAAAERLSDSAYMAAMRCRGLAEARQIDAAALEVLIKAQRSGRDAYIGERSRRMRKEAVRHGRDMGVGRKARVDAELDGGCRVYLAPASALAGSNQPDA